MQLSISDLKLYLKCPRAYKLRKIDGVEQNYKSLSYARAAAARRVITDLHSGEKKLAEYTQEEIGEICENIWREEISEVAQDDLDAVVVQEKSPTKKRPAIPKITKGERTLENIKTWCFEYSREEVDAEVLHSNIHFQTTIADTIFSGRIDLIRKFNNQLQIFVFNTSSQLPNPVYLKRDFILSLYSHAAWQGVLYSDDGSNEVSLETIPELFLYYLPNLERYQKKCGAHQKGDIKGNPFVDITRTEDDLLEFEYEILYTTSGIQQEFFPMMPMSPARCALCEYAEHCKSEFVFQEVSFDIEKFEEEKEGIIT